MAEYSALNNFRKVNVLGPRMILSRSLILISVTVFFPLESLPVRTMCCAFSSNLRLIRSRSVVSLSLILTSVTWKPGRVVNWIDASMNCSSLEVGSMPAHTGFFFFLSLPALVILSTTTAAFS